MLRKVYENLLWSGLKPTHMPEKSMLTCHMSSGYKTIVLSAAAISNNNGTVAVGGRGSSVQNAGKECTHGLGIMERWRV